MTSWSEHDEDLPDGPYVHHRLVERRSGDQEYPSQCGREAVVLGMRSNPHEAADPRRAGGWREGPTSSWWRSRLRDVERRDEYPPREHGGGRHRLTGRHEA